MPPSTRKSAVPQDHRTARKTAKKSTSSTQRVEVTTVDPDDAYAPTTWGSELGGAEDLIVPSGQKCLVRRPGVQGLMEAGVLRDLDSLSALVDEKHVKRVKGSMTADQIEVKALMGDPDAMTNLMHVVDRVLCHVVMKPPINMTPNDPTQRVPGAIYTDMVDLTDKMFIFNFAVGGTRSLESFREQLESAMGGVDPEQEAQEDAG